MTNIPIDEYSTDWKQRKRPNVWREQCSSEHTQKQSSLVICVRHTKRKTIIINPNFLISIDLVFGQINHLHSNSMIAFDCIPLWEAHKDIHGIELIRIQASDLCGRLWLIIVMNCVRLNYLRLSCEGARNLKKKIELRLIQFCGDDTTTFTKPN